MKTLTGDNALLLHATCVALGGAGLLIFGPSGVGKSGLALQMMALGCQLVSDDQTRLTRRDDGLWAAPMPALAGQIEARFIGILAAPHLPTARLTLAVDLSVAETGRLPPTRTIEHIGVSIPCLHRVDSAHFPAGLLLYLRAGRIA